METCASCDQVALTCDYAAMKQAINENRAMPSAIISPDEVIGAEERDRIEKERTRNEMCPLFPTGAD